LREENEDLKISGSSKAIKSFVRLDGKGLLESINAKDEDDDRRKLKDLRLYTNPLEGLFGYHAKHNRDS
jgi:hypothetical protein